MKSFRLISANISQCFIFAGKTYGEQLYSRFSPQSYIEYFKTKNPDILCVTELLLENQDGESVIAKQISEELNLPFYYIYVNEKTWLYDKKYYGMSIFSKYPLSNYYVFSLPNPKIKVIRPNGETWIMHDKGAQAVTCDIGGIQIELFNLHYFPFHHFKRSMGEPEFSPMRKELVNILLHENMIPRIITGDFNHLGFTLREAFPELDKNSDLTQAIQVPTTLIGLENQTDHVIYTKKDFRNVSGNAEQFLSDHFALIADFEI